ncbi:MAG: thiamine diphosphokinase [Anaerolineae bacterium]|nr:thiamine diphosphokinase [Anaerolineae bacterium]
MRAIIVASGHSADDSSWRSWVREGDLIIGADGGAGQALRWGLVPKFVIGDMDSLSERARQALEARGAQFVDHPRAKDQTDLELALSFAREQGARDIILFGVLGGRLDHTLSNLLLLTLPELKEVTVRVVHGPEEILVVRDGETVAVSGRPGDLISLLPWGGDVHGVTTQGLAWALEDDMLRFGFSRGVSNEMVGPEAEVSVRQGQLLLVHGPQPTD